MLRPGDLLMGCLSIGDDTDLLAAFSLLRVAEREKGTQIGPDDLLKARELISSRFQEALESPAGRRLYYGVTSQLDGHPGEAAEQQRDEAHRDTHTKEIRTPISHA
jgi:hypothetical protein